MLTHKYIGRITCGFLALCFAITAVFMNWEFFGITESESTNTYVEQLFSELSINTIDIIVDSDEWHDMLDNASEKEYINATLVINGETFTNIAIRPKGNSSLQQVQSSGSDRYSFKIEFDHYDSTKTYYGLDKLCLNNIVQDNTYMKDYLAYDLMNQFGVASPLANYVSVSVNGEVFGLYLAVEAIEDAFLQRNYGDSYGNLYKPETSESAVGGNSGGTSDRTSTTQTMETPEMSDMTGMDSQMQSGRTEMSGQMSGQMDSQMQSGMTERSDMMGQSDMMEQSTMGQEQMTQGRTEMTQGMTEQTGDLPDATQTLPDVDAGFTQDVPEMSQGRDQSAMMEQSDMMEPSDMTEPSDITEQSGRGDMTDTTQMEQTDRTDMMEQSSQMQSDRTEMSGGMSGQSGGMSSGMGSSSSGLDSAFGYDGDDPASYSYIFDNAVTAINESDQTRLIESIEQLNAQEDLEEVLDVEQMIRYFIVHNFLLNFDSYTGGIMHNYYLYEDDGVMTMLPWDYNLSFVAFQTSYSTEELINFPIDTPVSDNTVEDRPMLSWIFSNEEYTALYHELFQEFIDQFFVSGYFEDTVNAVEELISDEVESDPSKFCTFEQFTQGVATLKEFVALRVESIIGQLNGTIGSTAEAQAANPEALISAGDVDVTDTGTATVQTGQGNIQSPTRGQSSGGGQSMGGMMSNMMGGMMGMSSGGQSSGGQSQMSNMLPDIEIGERISEVTQSVGLSNTQVMLLGSVLVLLIGLLITWFYSRRRP